MNDGTPEDRLKGYIQILNADLLSYIERYENERHVDRSAGQWYWSKMQEVKQQLNMLNYILTGDHHDQ